MTCRKRRDDVETAGSRYRGTSFGDACLRTEAASGIEGEFPASVRNQLPAVKFQGIQSFGDRASAEACFWRATR